MVVVQESQLDLEDVNLLSKGGRQKGRCRMRCFSISNAAVLRMTDFP